MTQNPRTTSKKQEQAQQKLEKWAKSTLPPYRTRRKMKVWAIYGSKRKPKSRRSKHLLSDQKSHKARRKDRRQGAEDEKQNEDQRMETQRKE
jgi:hypothetical protein